MTHLISRTCIMDASCVPVCPVDAIHPGPHEDWFFHAEMLYIDPISCIDCGACLRACPIGAVRVDDDQRQDTTASLDLNAAYFASATPSAGGDNG